MTASRDRVGGSGLTFAAMGLSNIDFDAAIRRLADRRIEDAMAEGKFDNLEGAGKPLDLEPMPADAEARATWWALRIMRNANVTPDEVRYRKAIDGLRLKLARTRDERRARVLVAEINGLVRRINTLGATALKAPVTPVDEAVEVARSRGRPDEPNRVEVGRERSERFLLAIGLLRQRHAAGPKRSLRSRLTRLVTSARCSP